jgi:spore germination protein KC
MKVIKLILFMLIAALLTSCWDRIEINDQAIVLLTALDKGDKPGDYQALLHVAIPPRSSQKPSSSQGGGGLNKSYMPVTLKGSAINDMQLQLEQKLSRNVVISHRRVFIIGESLGRRGIKDTLDSISRAPDQRLRTYFVVAKGMTAKEFAEMNYPLENTLEEGIRETIVRNVKVPSLFRDIFAASAAPGIEPIAAAYTKSDDGRFRLTNIAIFRDYKLVGYIEGTEITALLSLLHRKPVDIVKFPIPNSNGFISVRITDLIVHRILMVKDNKPAFNLDIKAIGKVIGNSSNLDLGKPEYLEVINRELEQFIANLYHSMLAKLQKEYRADSAGFGQMIYMKNNKLWGKLEKDWPDLYPKLEIGVHVTANVTQVGQMGAPLYLEEDEVK